MKAKPIQSHNFHIHAIFIEVVSDNLSRYTGECNSQSSSMLTSPYENMQPLEELLKYFLYFSLLMENVSNMMKMLFF